MSFLGQTLRNCPWDNGHPFLVGSERRGLREVTKFKRQVNKRKFGRIPQTQLKPTERGSCTLFGVPRVSGSLILLALAKYKGALGNWNVVLSK